MDSCKPGREILLTQLEGEMGTMEDELRKLMSQSVQLDESITGEVEKACEAEGKETRPKGLLPRSISHTRVANNILRQVNSRLERVMTELGGLRKEECPR